MGDSDRRKAMLQDIAKSQPMLALALVIEEPEKKAAAPYMGGMGGMGGMGSMGMM